MPTSNITNYWTAAAVLGAAACWALYQFSSRIRRDRLIEDTPLVKIRSAAQGYVKVFGRARSAGTDPTAAPLSSRPCVWWSFDVEEKQRNAKGETTWRSINAASSITPFLLADGDGECLVGPVNAEITPTCHDVWYGDEPMPSGPPGTSRGFLSTDQYRYTERLLCAGDQVSVTGELRSNSEIETGDAATAALLRQWKSDQPALLARFDRNHDGKIDAAEWEAARGAAAAEAHAHALSSAIVRTSIIVEPTHGEPFLIAPMDSNHLVRREKLFAAIFFAMGIVCAGLCAWAIEHARALAG
ncbi:MAG TPA: GIDE domain-containing protein [Steroidobacteraceae bacterium]|nr:GIDE domain-containing protein [Steroidobacteraceae bacterium]